MNQFAYFTPKIESENYQDLFNSSTFRNSLNHLNIQSLGLPKKTDIVKVIYTQNDEENMFDENVVTETNKLMNFGNKAQIILKHYEVKLGQNTDVGEVVQIWMRDENNVVFKEYVQGKLVTHSFVKEIHDIYKDYLNLPEIPKASEKYLNSLIQPLYNPLSCIQSGSCCYFEKKRYEHCGKTCGIYENAGGGLAINAIDTCCRTHDIQIKGKKKKDRCTPHKNFMKCTKNLSGPGYHTIRNGIRADALINFCGAI